MLQLNLFMIYRVALLSLLLAILPSCAGPGKSIAQNNQRSLEQLRNQLAMRYFDALPHVELAKYFRDEGNRLMAFYILETARRHRVDEKDFDNAFRAVFGGAQPIDYSPSAEEALLREHTRDPKAVDTAVKLADLYISRKDWTKAKDYISKAIGLAPDNFENTAALAAVLRNEGKTEEAERVIREYASKYPETPEGYRIRVGELFEKEPGRAKILLLEAVKKFPKNGEFLFDLGTILQRENKLQEAEAHFVRAAEMAPNSVRVQSWTGRFFHKVKKDDPRALDYYLNAYLLDPHAYESEFVESRIQKINAALAEAEFERQLKNGVPITKLVQDPNPLMASIAVEKMTDKWEPAHLKTYLDLMGHDDGGVRWYATMAIEKYVDRSFDATLKSLLKDSDLRKRGLAAYIAIHLWKQESFDTLRSMLREEAQLLRFDAISALMMEGGPEGRNIVLDHLSRETDPRIKKLIQSSLTP